LVVAAEWYYAKDNKRHGPLTEAQLHELAASGQLQPSDMVWKQGMQAWTPANKIEGLFSSVSPPPLPTTDSAGEPIWSRVWKNKPLFFGLALAASVLFMCVSSPLLTVLPSGLDTLLFLIWVGLIGTALVGLAVTGYTALNKSVLRDLRQANLHGKWEPVSGEGCSLWFFQDGGFMRSDGFGAKYSHDAVADQITVTVEGFGTPIPLKVISLNEHELVLGVEGQAIHYKKGTTISEQRWQESAQRNKEFLMKAGAVVGKAAAVTVGAVGVATLGLLVLGGAAAGAAAGGNASGSEWACKKCKMPVPYEAEVCGHCGVKNPANRYGF
jgi:hypothetical protein